MREDFGQFCANKESVDAYLSRRKGAGMMDYEALTKRLRGSDWLYRDILAAANAIETLRKERDEAFALAEEELTAAFMAGYAAARKELK